VQLTISTGRLPLAIEAAGYFPCSEALTNVAKYAGAAHVAVDVSQSKRRITATVADDGVGGPTRAGARASVA
jgi:signal transduction histidine kinase